MERKFKEHLSKMLKATGYGLNVTPDELPNFDDPELAPFYEWFCSNVTEENCLTTEELSEFQKLEEAGEVLYGDELDEALQARMSRAADAPPCMLESTLEAKKDELSVLQEQFDVKTQLLSTVNASVVAVSEDIKKLSKELKEEEEWNMTAATNVLQFNQIFNLKLEEIKVKLESGRRKFSVLAQSNESSADEGISTLASTDLDASSISTASVSTLTSSRTLVKMDSNYTFLSQMPFDKYLRQDQRFKKLIEKIVRNKKVLEKKADNDQEVELELLNALDRLSKQKKSLILNAAEIEGLKAAQQKLDEIMHQVQLGRGKQVLSNLNKASESMDSGESDHSIDLQESCQTWAESRILEPLSELQQHKMEDYKVLIDQLEHLKKDLKLKLATDKILSEMLVLEEETVVSFFEIHRKLERMLVEMQEAHEERMQVMEENLEDYRDYQSLPLEERYEPVGWLAEMLGTEKRDLVQAVDALDKTIDSKRKAKIDHYQQTLQNLLKQDQELTHRHKGLAAQTSSQASDNTNSELYQTIQTQLNEMDDLIEETNLRLNATQGTMFEHEEESEAEKLLAERMSQLKKE